MKEYINEYYHDLDFTPQRLKIYQNILLEENQFLKNPQSIFQHIYQQVLNLYQNKQYETEITIYIKDLINNALYDNLKESIKPLYQQLQFLFKNSNNYLTLKISKTKCFINNDILNKGLFQINSWFGQFNCDFKHIQILNDLQFPNIKKIIKQQINDQLDKKQIKYDILQHNIEIFKQDINNCLNICQITIYPDNCTLDDTNIDLPTLEEVVEHECQHLCIFLLSIAKTYIYFGKHFSNVNWTSQYELNENEFITLLGSYSNILIRIFKKYQIPKDQLNTYIHTCIALFLDKPIPSLGIQYIEYIKNSKMYDKIKQFYQQIYKDKIFVIKDENQNPITPIYNNNKKFKLLLNWTYKNLKDSLFV